MPTPRTKARIAGVLYLIVIGALYEIYRPVSRTAALMFLSFALVQNAVEFANTLNHFSPLIFLTGPASALPQAAVRAIVAAALELHTVEFAMTLGVFSIACVIEAYLIVRSRLVPAVLGLMMGLAGACYLAHSLTIFLAPGLSHYPFPVILLPCFVAELSLALWLAVRGIDVVRWAELVP